MTMHGYPFFRLKWGMVAVVAVLLFSLSCSKSPLETSSTATPNQPATYSATVSESDSLFCIEGVQTTGALYRICVPRYTWNGELFIWAHGYESPLKSISLPDDAELVELVTGMGYAYATTSYSKTGLAIKQGVEDVSDLVTIFEDQVAEPNYTYLVGGSEGGIVTTLAVEKHPEQFSGGLAMCGPIGDFARQINYFGDFRVVFDYFFPGVIPGSPINIPQEVMLNFESKYIPRILDAIHAEPDKTLQLLRVTGAPFDPTNPATIDETVISVLWFNVFSTNDGQQTLGGQPFDNMNRYYRGSANDADLNRRVQRFAADPQALDEIEQYYQTSGQLQRHIVTLHTIADPVIPFWHERLYRSKVAAAGATHYIDGSPVIRYGHCTFEPEEVLAAFAWLVFRVKGEELAGLERVLQNPKARALYAKLQENHRPVAMAFPYN